MTDADGAWPDERAARVVDAAEEAARADGRELRVEHLLTALLDAGGDTGRLLAGAGVTAASLRDGLPPPEDGEEAGDWSGDAGYVWWDAIRVALLEGHEEITPEHLLTAVLHWQIDGGTPLVTGIDEEDVPEHIGDAAEERCLELLVDVAADLQEDDPEQSRAFATTAAGLHDRMDDHTATDTELALLDVLMGLDEAATAAGLAVRMADAGGPGEHAARRNVLRWLASLLRRDEDPAPMLDLVRVFGLVDPASADAAADAFVVGTLVGAVLDLQAASPAVAAVLARETIVLLDRHTAALSDPDERAEWAEDEAGLRAAAAAVPAEEAAGRTATGLARDAATILRLLDVASAHHDAGLVDQEVGTLERALDLHRRSFGLDAGDESAEGIAMSLVIALTTSGAPGRAAEVAAMFGEPERRVLSELIRTVESARGRAGPDAAEATAAHLAWLAEQGADDATIALGAASGALSLHDGAPGPAAELARRALEIIDAVPAPAADDEDPDRATLDQAEAVARYTLGKIAADAHDHAVAVRHLERAHDLVRVRADADLSLRVHLLGKLAWVYASVLGGVDMRRQRDAAHRLMARARALSDEAATLFERLPPGRRAMLGAIIAEPALLLAHRTGDYDSAIAFTERLLDTAGGRDAPPPDVRGLAELRILLSEVLIYKGEARAARAALRPALPVFATISETSAKVARRRYRWATVQAVWYPLLDRLFAAERRVLTGARAGGTGGDAPVIAPSPLGTGYGPLTPGMLGGAKIPERLEFRPGPASGAQFLLPFTARTAGLAGVSAFAYLRFGPQGPLDLYWIALLCILGLWSLFAAAYLAPRLSRSSGPTTVLGPGTIWDSGKLIGGDAVTGVRVVRGLVNRRVRITLRGGRRRTLTLPLGWAWHDPAFEADAGTVRHWVTEHGGRDDRPGPPVRAIAEFAAIALSAVLIVLAVAVRGVAAPWGPAARNVPGACSLHGPALDRIMPAAGRAPVPGPPVRDRLRESSTCTWSTATGWRTTTVTIHHGKGIVGLFSGNWVAATLLRTSAERLAPVRRRGGVGDEALSGTAADGHHEMIAREGDVTVVLAFYGDPPDAAAEAGLARAVLGRVAFSSPARGRRARPAAVSPLR
jgi:hypothetical protein